MTRKLNTESETEIKRWEGKGGKAVLIAYRDSGGVWTIGWGHTGIVDGKHIHDGMAITPEKAEELFDSDMAWACQAVEEAVKVELTDNQFGALVSWTENVGAGAMKGSTLIKRLNKGDYNSIPAEFQKWVKDKNPRTGKMETVPGLVNRRAADAGLWTKGDFVAGAIATTAAKASPPVAHRDVANHTATGILGTAVAVGPILPQISDAVSGQQDALTSGDFVKIAIALIILAGVGYTIYRSMKAGI